MHDKTKTTAPSTTPARVPGRECASCCHGPATFGDIPKYLRNCAHCRDWSRWEPKPCAERALRDINGECSAQCVAAPAARGER